MLVNGTAPARSLASLDRWNWLDDDERQELADSCGMISLELIAEIHTERPGYLRILSSESAGNAAAALQRPAFAHKLIEVPNRSLRERLWVTGFSLTGRKGIVKSVDAKDGAIHSINDRTSRSILWPNEVAEVPNNPDALLIADGFLVPGKDRGGIYVVSKPGSPQYEWNVCLTKSTSQERWFDHKAAWIDLTGDGRLSVLAARCQLAPKIGSSNNGVTSGIVKHGELVWLECPKAPRVDPRTGSLLEEDGTLFDPFSSRHVPWKLRTLTKGPDVMMSIADLDPTDDTIEVISSQFFGEKVSVHSVQRGPQPKVVNERIIDDQCGSAFGCVLANLDHERASKSGRVVMDSGSTIQEQYTETSFSHVLVTSHECSYTENESRSQVMDDSATGSSVHIDGGSLFAYQVPNGKDAWKTQPWPRTVIASGFKVQGQLKNMINPGAPGFVYTFYANKQDALSANPKARPLIAVAGDCAESAYIFRPESDSDPTRYKLMVEVQCESTVGSLAVGYDDFTDVDQEHGFAKLYIPCYEKDRILVFALGSGEDEDDGW